MADRIKQMQKLIDRKIKEIESSGGTKKKKKPEDMLPKKNGLLARGTQGSEMQDEEDQKQDAEEIVAEYIMNIRKFREEALNAKDKQK